MLVILQWNARSLVANGLEFKGYLNKMEEKPDVICVQESWLKPKLDFVIKGYVSVRRDREEGNGGGCVTFIKSEMQYRMVGKGREMEYVVVEVWKGDKSVVIINFYNPCRQMTLEDMLKIEGQSRERVIWCGDFNAHSSMWGGSVTDRNGKVVEELMDEMNLICMNDRGGTRVDMRTGQEAVLDLTLVKSRLGGKINWKVLRKCTIGSDHFPVLIEMCVNMNNCVKRSERREGRWNYEKANWTEYVKRVEEGIDINEVRSVDDRSYK